MPCTTILVGKKASYDGSTMIARNDDGRYEAKKLIVVDPSKQPRKYKSVISHVEIELPDNPLKYTSTPNVSIKEGGVWPANGINEANVGMTATETITSNAVVLGADPLVKLQKSHGKHKEIPGGIGEEDLVLLVLPYIKSAREGVLRLGSLLEKYGTYESNGIAFNDKDEIWWLESIGGHHWIAKRVKDEEYVIMPNQFGLDNFDWDDAYGEGKENLCSKDLKEFVEKNHLDSNQNGKFNPRLAFGSHADSDHVYNTPRAWYMARYFNPRTYKWDGPDADFTPESDDIPWALVPERKIRVEEIKYILSSYYQGTPYNPYLKVNNGEKGKYRPIGVSRTSVMGVLQIRGYMPKEIQAIEWICFGPNPFNAMLPMYTNVDKMPSYVGGTGLEVDTNYFFWASRVLAAMADPHFGECVQLIERYQRAMENMGQKQVHDADEAFLKNNDLKIIGEANEATAREGKKLTQAALDTILLESSKLMKCNYFRADN